MIKGSKIAMEAGKKAAETRRMNKISTVKKVRNSTLIKTKSMSFSKMKEEDYTKISISVPVNIYIHKKLQTMYISPQKIDVDIS